MKELIAGVDEVGRGCLAGPVIAAAVILKTPIDDLNDSKKISKNKREFLSSLIMQNSFFAFGSVSHKEIDEIAALFENELTADYKDDIFKLTAKTVFYLILFFIVLIQKQRCLDILISLKKETCRLIIA